MLMVRETHPTDNELWMILTMSNYRRANANGGTYFFTVVTYHRQGFLCNKPGRVHSMHRKHHWEIKKHIVDLIWLEY